MEPIASRTKADDEHDDPDRPQNGDLDEEADRSRSENTPPQRGCVVETMRVVNTARHHDRALPRTGDPEV